jgi:hypothetical protein
MFPSKDTRKLLSLMQRKIFNLKSFSDCTLSFYLTLFAALVLLSGCASIKREKVEFINPYTILSVEKTDPDAAELKGVALRLKKQDAPVVYNDIVQVYTQISEGTAIPVNVKKSRKVIFKSGKSPETFQIVTETNTTKSNLREGIEEVEVDSRGQIIKFIKGEFTTKHGKMTFLSHKRSPIFPEKKVKVGDKWSYEEQLEMKFDSSLISRKSEKPDDIKVNCVLTGFALVQGRRCAVIKSRTVTKRVEHYSTLWKEMKFNVNIYVYETLYFDYQRGILAGSITKTDSYSTSEKLDFSDMSRSQSISVIEKKDE